MAEYPSNVLARAFLLVFTLDRYIIHTTYDIKDNIAGFPFVRNCMAWRKGKQIFGKRISAPTLSTSHGEPY